MYRKKQQQLRRRLLNKCSLFLALDTANSAARCYMHRKRRRHSLENQLVSTAQILEISSHNAKSLGCTVLDYWVIRAD